MSVVLPPFQAFLDAHRDEVHRFCVAAVGRQEADDCFQETFLAALRAYPGLHDASNLRAWVLTIARNKVIDTHRARGRQPRAEPEGWTLPPDGEPELWRAVRRLPPKQRAAVVHRYVSDLPYADVARVMGCSEEAARRSAHDGVQRLRTIWEGEGR